MGHVRRATGGRPPASSPIERYGARGVGTIAADFEGRVSAFVLHHRPAQQEELNVTAKQHRSDVRHGSQERDYRDDRNNDCR